MGKTCTDQRCWLIFSSEMTSDWLNLTCSDGKKSLPYESASPVNIKYQKIKIVCPLRLHFHSALENINIVSVCLMWTSFSIQTFHMLNVAIGAVLYRVLKESFVQYSIQVVWSFSLWKVSWPELALLSVTKDRWFPNIRKKFFVILGHRQHK